MKTKQVSNLIELLQQRVQQQPRQKAYTFLVDGEDQEVSLTYEQLDQRASAIAAWLQYLHATGERVLLLYPPGLEYITAFWGCLYAGAIAVPAYPPRQNRSLNRLQSIAEDAESTLALTTSALLAKTDALAVQCPDLKNLRWLATETVADEVAQHWRRPAIGSDDLAFLQYTSGSTSTPKGVMVTHGNLLSNEEMIKHAFGQSEQSIIVGWLPLYHDMGLIGNVLQPIYVGAPCVLMSPVSFLQNPYRWLAAISRYRATTSGGPNFAYDLCVRKISTEQRESLDLSSWEVAFNGAEPVRAETMTAFAEAFGPYGFRQSAFRPCYGLAEATLLVSTNDAPLVKTVDAEALQKNAAVEVSNGTALVSCGRPSLDQIVRVCRPDTVEECLPGEVGEICVSGANVTKGYWNRAEETGRVFQSGAGGDMVLRTGDLGVLLDGNLFVTGRIKDLIIIRGRNHYPHDIERTVERSHPALRAGSGAAFSVEIEGEERLVVAHELNGRGRVDRDEIMRAINEAVVDEHELQPHAVMLLKTGSIPKTSSGKIQRHACREKFLMQSFDVVAEWKAHARGENEETDLESWLRAELAAKRGVSVADIDANRPLSDYALDSLEAIELTHRVEEKFSFVLSMASLLQNPTIAEIAAQAQSHPQITLINNLCNLRMARSEFPLSHGQRALWFLYQLAPESAAYNISTALRVVSDLDTAALRRSFQILLDRHPSLRTVFEVHDDQPVQRIVDHAEISFIEIDASTWDESKLNECLVAEAQRPFDLQHGPVLRVHVFSRAENDHVVLLAIHHIVSDFWSLSVLATELGAIYSSEISGVPAQLPTNTLEYSDFVEREQESLSGPDGERLSSYWLRQLAGDLPILDLPTDHPRPPVQTYHGASLGFDLSEEVTKGLKQLAKAHGATLYTTLLAAFQTLLFRYTGQEDLLVGSPTAGRNQNGLASLVGYFVNPIVLRSNPSANKTFASFLDQTKQTVLDAFAHQDYPFPLLVERLQPERDTSRSPLFQTMFILQKAHLLDREGLTSFTLGEAGARMWLDALEVESVALDQRISQFELTLVMAEDGERLSASLQYNTDLFERATIARMADHLKALLQGIVTEPQQTLSQLPLLTQAEQQQILFDWNSTTVRYPRDLCLHQLFEAQAARTPEATALIFGEERLTYSELNHQAERLAAYLLQHGVGPEVLVGVCMERSVEMVVTLLSILKAGGAYVPLDPAYPAERLAFMLEDGEVRLLISQESLVEKLPPFETMEDFSIDTLRPLRLCVNKPVSSTAAKVQPANLAYVIYTSGSTGKPKGVAITHHSAVIMAYWAGAYFTSEQLAGVLASTSISFDLSVFELFAPLSTGGTVILAENALQLPLLPARSEVTLVNTVPSAMAELVRSGSIPPSVETVNLAGEALPRELVRQLYQIESVKSVVNLYGPSEDTTYSTFALIARDDEKAPAIGRPLPDTQAYVLDKAGQPVPVGVAGELYLGGEGLSRGYLNRPELTAERFVPDRFSDTPGARLYRTGDLVRFAGDGVLEYLGRMDHQVKLRGFRIELGEIEEVLRRHEAVTEAAVIVSDCEGEKRLLAFVVSAEQPMALRASLRERLPEYMVPQAFITLAELPLTANGKVDRRALLALDVPQLGDKEIAAPRTETEIVVSEMWRELLRVNHASLDDNFFEAGGHSLLATRLMSQVTKRFDTEVTLRSFFEDPTIAGLASQIDLTLQSAPALKAPPITRRRAIANAPLSFAQQRLWFLSQLEADNTAYNMPAALKLSGELDIEALEDSLSEIIRRHEILRTIFVTEDGEPVQVVLPARRVEIPQIDLSTHPATEREAEALRLATEEAQKPFDLSQGPLIRFTLLQLASDEHVLLFTVHHIVFDGWSIGVLVKELTALYRDEGVATEINGAELPVQYGDFATWQREWLQGEVMDLRLAYWRKQLADAPEALNLPTDKPRPAVLSTNGATQSFQLPAELVDALKTLANEERATLFMVLLATFHVLLSRYSGQTDVLVGTAVANRNRAEIENSIGFFVNMLVIRGDLSGDPTFNEYLAKIRETALAAYGHQDMPFETIVESLQVGRSLNRTPLFQTTFVLQNEPAAELELSGLSLTPLHIDAGRAQFDLSLSMSETKDGCLNGSLNYNTDLFCSSTIARMQEHFRTLLESVVHNPQTRLSALPLLTENERQQILFNWNDNAAAYPENLCLHQLFEAQAARTPEATALIFGDERLTYRELHSRAARLAAHLRERGVGPEALVGVCMERSVEMVVALLGILKAGGAYVPLDPTYPAERLAFMLEDADLCALITQPSLLKKLPPAFETSSEELFAESLRLCVNRSVSRTGAKNAKVDPANLAYVIYTSGSTGKPKGVAITHQSGVTMVQWAGDYFTREQLAGMLASTSISFDLSVFELFVPLSVGGAVILAENALQLPTLPAAGEVTLVNTVPSAIAELSRNNWIPANVRTINLAGEALSRELVDHLYQQHTVERVINLYGPSEDTTYSTFALIKRADNRTPAIGRPLPNTAAYVLDGAGYPVPVGVIGELYLGGMGLSRGYLNRAELTAERFMPDPFSSKGGARLYRTGDLVRFTEQGVLEYLGRIDHQVKVRGYRIELAEVESVLRQHEQVREAVVIVREQDGDKRLVAYLTGDTLSTTGMLRSWLRDRLPDYMVPQAFVVLEQMPLTSNGKVARRALLSVGTLEFAGEKAIVEPRTETEIAVAKMWCEILGVNQVSVDQNFFEIGGHSLLATRLMSHVTKAFGVEISLRRFFEAPTVEAQANEIDLALKAETKFTMPSIGRASRDRYRMNITPHGPITLPDAMRN